MGYRSEIVAGVPLKDKKKALKIIDNWDWVLKKGKMFFMGATDWKWYTGSPGYTHIKEFEDFITDVKDDEFTNKRFLLCVGEDGDVHTEYGDAYEHHIYPTTTIVYPFRTDNLSDL